MVVFCHVAPVLIPTVNKAQLNAQNRRLQRIEPAIPANLIVVVALPHAVHAKRGCTLGDPGGVGGDHAPFAGRTEVLGGVETEGGRVPQGSSFAALPTSTKGLGRIFDQQYPVLLPYLLEA